MLKTDLHLHLDGSLRISTLIDLAQTYDIKLPSYTVEGLKEDYKQLILANKGVISDLNENWQKKLIVN